jgi:hypothetical protein
MLPLTDLLNPLPRHSAEPSPPTQYDLPAPQNIPVLSPPRSHATSPLPNVQPTVHSVRLNRKTKLHLLFRYSQGTVVEYPETSAEGPVGHLFEVSPDDWTSPRLNFTYSQGAPTGRTKAGSHVFCPLLVDDNGEMVPCQEVHSTCMSCNPNIFDFCHDF